MEPPQLRAAPAARPTARVLFAELRRRHVFHVAAGYAAAAFIVAQAADIFMPGLGLPEWSLRLVLVLLVAGFPVAVVLGWIYDLTPRGIVRTTPAEAQPNAMVQPAAQPATAGTAPTITSGILQGHAAGAVSAPVRSIAVLPFANTSADPENEYFSDGIAEELMNMLAQVPGLRVPARTSAFAFKGRNESIRRIGEELGVEAVLEGSVRKSGDRVRITAQLVATADGFQLWSGRFDRQLVDIFAIQEQTARAVVTALQLALPGGRRTAAARRAADPAAHDVYLRGLYALNQANADTLPRAIDCFRQAIARDAGFAPPHAGLAIALSVLPVMAHTSAATVYADARAAAQRALELDPDLPDAHTALAYVLLRLDWDWDRAQHHFRRALELNPNSARTHELYAEFLIARDRVDEALYHSAQSEALDALSLHAACEAALLRYLAGDVATARQRLDHVLAVEPGYFKALWYSGIVDARLGRHDAAIDALERTAQATGGLDLFRAFVASYGYAPAGRMADARRVLDELVAAARTRPVTPAALAVVHAALGERDAAFRFLERAIREREIPAFVVPRDPLFEPLRSDPRYSRLLAAMGLPHGGHHAYLAAHDC
jgi:adenylate cyclase